ncbi:MAG: YbaN family protein [Coriobacteriia bacterium]|nr:YbaN family protein [Coriobacteriia bacterium]
MNPVKILYIILGFIFLGLGAVGAFIPVLPTVPFLLLTAFFFSKGSKRFEKWFMTTKLYKKHLEGFLANRTMTRKTKVYLQGLATVMILISVYVVPIMHVKIFLLVLLFIMYWYFAFRIRTVKPAEKAMEGVILPNEDEDLRASVD